MQLPRSLEILSQENAVCALREEKQSAREIKRGTARQREKQREGGRLQDVKYKREEEEGDSDNTLGFL